MDIQNVNSLNAQLNIVSGNLLPMTADDTSFPIFWKVYSILTWLLQIIKICVLIPGCIYVPKEKVLIDGMLGIVSILEVVFLTVQIYSHKKLMQQLIQKLNDILHVDDEIMRNTIMNTIKPIKIPVKYYWTVSMLSIILLNSASFMLIFQKDTFYYVDFKMPVVFSKEPFSINIFVFGNLIVMLSGLYIMTKKVGVESYIINIILLITAQYKYIALKLSIIFQDVRLQSSCNSSNEKKHYPQTNFCAKEKIKFICQHYKAVLHVTIMLRELLAMSISIIYLNSVFRICCFAITVITIPSIDSMIKRALIIMLASTGVMQLYILCSCVQQLLDASNEITDQAFHEPWYRFEGSIKRTFMFLIMANNLELKLSMFKRYNLSLASFITILNQSYSIALILLKTN